MAKEGFWDKNQTRTKIKVNPILDKVVPDPGLLKPGDPNYLRVCDVKPISNYKLSFLPPTPPDQLRTARRMHRIDAPRNPCSNTNILTVNRNQDTCSPSTTTSPTPGKGSHRCSPRLMMHGPNQTQSKDKYSFLAYIKTTK